MASCGGGAGPVRCQMHLASLRENNTPTVHTDRTSTELVLCTTAVLWRECRWRKLRAAPHSTPDNLSLATLSKMLRRLRLADDSNTLYDTNTYSTWYYSSTWSLRSTAHEHVRICRDRHETMIYNTTVAASQEEQEIRAQATIIDRFLLV